jgi:hypothetical protein
MRKPRLVAIATGLLLLGALLGVAPRGTVHADQASQTWYGANGSCFTGSLDDGSTCIGHFHNSAAPSKCLDVPGYRFFNVTSGALDIFSDLDASGTQVQLWDCEPQDGQHGFDYNQIWYAQNNGDGSWTFKVAGYVRYCLDSQGLQSSGATVVVNPCHGEDSQKWMLDPTGEQLQSVGSAGYCVDTDPATFQDDGNGAQVVLEPCVGLASALYPSY